jgi:hypothetical protein
MYVSCNHESYTKRRERHKMKPEKKKQSETDSSLAESINKLAMTTIVSLSLIQQKINHRAEVL